MVMFHCYVKLPEGTSIVKTTNQKPMAKWEIKSDAGRPQAATSLAEEVTQLGKELWVYKPNEWWFYGDFMGFYRILSDFGVIQWDINGIYPLVN